jgi:hypothetical protein
MEVLSAALAGIQGNKTNFKQRGYFTNSSAVTQPLGLEVCGERNN